MGSIDITKNTSVRLGNIGQVRQAYAGDFSAPAKAMGRMGEAVGGIGKLVGNIAVDMQERENAAKVNEAMSSLLIGSGRISDGILSDGNLSPSEYQNRFKEDYDKLYGEVTKDLNSAQLEKMRMAASRVYTLSMVSLGHTAMQRTVAQEKASAANLCAAAKLRAVNSPNEETIGFYLGAFTDAEKDAVREIHALEEAGKTKEAAALREALRIRQRQGLDEILAEEQMNKIRAAEMSGDEAALEELANRDWLKDPNADAAYNVATDRTGFGENTAHVLKHNAQQALKRLKYKAVEERKISFTKCQSDIGEIELNLANPQKVDETGRSLDYETYCARLKEEHPNLTEAQSVELRREYRALCTYYDNYQKYLAKYQAAQAKAKEQYGFFEGGIFYPASAFPENSDTSSLDEFNTASSVWQDPKSAMAKLEAARMTGRLSRADYIAYKKHGQMLMNDEAKTWWYKMYGKFDIPGLTGAEYGEENVSRDIRKLRGKKNYTAASGIYAANKGSTGKLYRSAADFVADTLEHDGYKERSGWENESLVPIETLPKVYDTVLRLAKAGVDPADAVRAILQPAIEEGLRRDLNERLSDPDYFTSIVSNFRAHGTHFFGDSTKQTAGGGANWYADRNQAVTSSLLRQNRIKPEESKTVKTK